MTHYSSLAGHCSLLAVLLLATGCTYSASQSVNRSLVQIPNSTAIPHVLVYGEFASLLPHFDVTPALQMFLYGPNDYGKTSVRNPQGMACLGQTLYVADQGLPDLVAIDLTTGRSLSFTHPDHRPRCPVDVATDGQRLYVADTTARTVIVYATSGHRLEQLACAPEHPFRPVSVRVQANILYVGNVAGHCVERFDLAARQWLEPLTPPTEAKPLAAPTGLDFLADGTLLIVDAIQGHVLRYTADGRWLAPIGAPGRMAGQFVRPKQVAHTPSGLIVVADAGRQSLLVFDADGRHLMEVHEQNNNWHGFTLPAGVLSLPPESLTAIFGPSGSNLPPADEYVLVSDELGAPALTLLGIVTRPGGEVAHAR